MPLNLERRKKYMENWRLENSIRLKKYQKEYDIKNQEQRRTWRLDWYFRNKKRSNKTSRTWKAKNIERIRKTQKAYREKHPYYHVLGNIQKRCNNPENNRYYRYGARGIKNFLTFTDIKFLWTRDKAEKMKCPTIDRIDNDGNYVLKNCRFIERSENTRKRFRDAKGGYHGREKNRQH